MNAVGNYTRERVCECAHMGESSLGQCKVQVESKNTTASAHVKGKAQGQADGRKGGRKQDRVHYKVGGLREGERQSERENRTECNTYGDELGAGERHGAGERQKEE